VSVDPTDPSSSQSVGLACPILKNIVLHGWDQVGTISPTIAKYMLPLWLRVFSSQKKRTQNEIHLYVYCCSVTYIAVST
jgi:hypothetical protein